jgi:hypothetical protein
MNKSKKSSVSLQLLREVDGTACVSSVLLILINIVSRFTLKIIVSLVFYSYNLNFINLIFESGYLILSLA